MASIHFDITWELNHLHRKTFIQFFICLLYGRSLSLRIEVRFLVVSLLVLLVEKSVVCGNLLPGNLDLPTHPTQRKKGGEGGREEGRKAGRKEGRNRFSNHNRYRPGCLFHFGSWRGCFLGTGLRWIKGAHVFLTEISENVKAPGKQ